MLDRGRAARAMLENPFGNFGGDINLSIVMARTRATGNMVERDNAVLTTQSLSFELGDTLVPYDTTVAWLGNAAQFVKQMTGPIREHAFLCVDPAVMNVVTQGMA